VIKLRSVNYIIVTKRGEFHAIKFDANCLPVPRVVCPPLNVEFDGSEVIVIGRYRLSVSLANIFIYQGKQSNNLEVLAFDLVSKATNLPKSEIFNLTFIPLTEVLMPFNKSPGLNLSVKPMNSISITDVTQVDHSILLPDGTLIGNSFNVSATISGGLKKGEEVVIDFGAAKKLIKSIIDEKIDHKVWHPIKLDYPDIEDNGKVITNPHAYLNSITDKFHDVRKLDKFTFSVPDVVIQNSEHPQLALNYFIDACVKSVLDKIAITIQVSLGGSQIGSTAIQVELIHDCNFNVKSSGLVEIAGTFNDSLQRNTENAIRIASSHLFVGEMTNHQTFGGSSKGNFEPKLTETFRYCHGLPQSTSLACQGLGHGHLSFANISISHYLTPTKKFVTDYLKLVHGGKPKFSKGFMDHVILNFRNPDGSVPSIFTSLSDADKVNLFNETVNSIDIDYLSEKQYMTNEFLETAINLLDHIDPSMILDSLCFDLRFDLPYINSSVLWQYLVLKHLGGTYSDSLEIMSSPMLIMSEEHEINRGIMNTLTFGYTSKQRGDFLLTNDQKTLVMKGETTIENLTKYLAQSLCCALEGSNIYTDEEELKGQNIDLKEYLNTPFSGSLIVSEGLTKYAVCNF
jgi:6-pyruvoyl-tetrahydropterin synthase